MANFVFLHGKITSLPKKALKIDTQDGKKTGKKYTIVVETKTQLIREDELSGRKKYKYIYEPIRVILYGRKVNEVMKWNIGDLVSIFGKITGRYEHIKGVKNPVRMGAVVVDHIENVSHDAEDADEVLYIKNSVKGVGMMRALQNKDLNVEDVKDETQDEKPESFIKKRKDLEEEFDIDDDYIIEY